MVQPLLLFVHHLASSTKKKGELTKESRIGGEEGRRGEGGCEGGREGRRKKMKRKGRKSWRRRESRFAS